MERKQIKNICISQDLGANSSFSENINIPFDVNYLEASIEVSTADTVVNCCVHSNLIPNEKLALSTMAGIVSKNTLKEHRFGGLYTFNLLDANGDPETTGDKLVFLQLIFYE